VTAAWAGPEHSSALLFPNRIDCDELRRRLDDMQLAGLDFVTLERWRKLLDAYESGEELRCQVGDAASDLEVTLDGLGVDPSDHRIDISGTLDDLEGEPGQLTPAARKVIEAAIEKKQKEADDELNKRWGAAVEDLRAVVKKLDEASGKDADPSEPDRAERKEQQAKAAKAALAKEVAKRKPKVTLNPARQR